MCRKKKSGNLSGPEAFLTSRLQTAFLISFLVKSSSTLLRSFAVSQGTLHIPSLLGFWHPKMLFKDVYMKGLFTLFKAIFMSLWVNSIGAPMHICCFMKVCSVCITFLYPLTPWLLKPHYFFPLHISLMMLRFSVRFNDSWDRDYSCCSSSSILSSISHLSIFVFQITWLAHFERTFLNLSV